jgi:hypothetical protein|tara:strand:- start:65 stop:457 length:393 start_codon:yes stop_codon:yes gene_type:complete
MVHLHTPSLEQKDSKVDNTLSGNAFVVRERARLQQHSADYQQLNTKMDLIQVAGEGAKGLGYAFALSGTSIGLLNHFHTGFRGFMNRPGKIYLVTMLSTFGAALFSEQEVVRQNKNNWRRGIEQQRQNRR